MQAHVGMEYPKKQKQTELDGNDTTTRSHHTYILCHSSCQVCISLHAYSYALSEQGTQHCSLHSPPSSPIAPGFANGLSAHKILGMFFVHTFFLTLSQLNFGSSVKRVRIEDV